MNPSDPYVWHCSSCGRRVPRRVEACRCGFRQPGDPAPVDTPAVDTPPPTGRRGVLLLLIGLLLGLGLTAIPLSSLWPPTVRLAPDATHAAGPLRGTRPSSEGVVPREFSDPPGVPSLSNVEGIRTSPDPVQVPAFVVTSPASALLEDVIARTLPAVVSIQAGQGRGTGFFIRPELVLTNAHVVGSESSVQLMAGDRKYTARVTTVSTSSDLAVLQVYNADARHCQRGQEHRFRHSHSNGRRHQPG